MSFTTVANGRVARVDCKQMYEAEAEYVSRSGTSSGTLRGVGRMRQLSAQTPR